MSRAHADRAPPAAPDSDALKTTLRRYADHVHADIMSRLPQAPHGTYAKSLDDYRARPQTHRRDPYLVYDPIQHVVEAGGKRIRPILTLLACEAVCGDMDRALPTASGLELLHTFTLVHDDVMDNDMTRRGQPTVHALWGGSVAITAGDGLYALAFEAIADNGDHPDVAAETVLAVTRRAAQVSFEICAGQTQDILFEETDDVDRDAYMEMIRLKTGVLLAVSVEAGARIGGAPEDDIARLAQFGHELGLAFQIKDDLLDLMGQEAQLGKPIGSDIRAGKKTHPVLHALDTLEGDPRRRLLEILATNEDETTATMVAEALRILDKCGALQAADDAARNHIANAKAALCEVRTVADQGAMDTLEAIADYIIQRTT